MELKDFGTTEMICSSTTVLFGLPGEYAVPPVEELRQPLMTDSEFTRCARYTSFVPFQCSCNKPRLEMIELFIQSSAYQPFIIATHVLHVVHHYATARPQAFKFRLTCAVADKPICLSVCVQQF